MSKHFKSNPAILNEARDYLDGLVLGDGHIPSVMRSGTDRYTQRCKEKEWLDLISENLYEYGIESKVSNGRLHIGGWQPEGGSILYDLQTHYYIEFKEMHDRWYKPWYDINSYDKRFWHRDEDGEYFIWKKIVPKDICLTSECIANWYLGDGTCSKHTYSNGYQIQISTDGFLREDTMFVSELLSDVLDIKNSVTKAKVIYIGIQSDISTFLNYIKDYKVECYSYKFPEELINHGI